jgi:hypothetical protein
MIIVENRKLWRDYCLWGMGDRCKSMLQNCHSRNWLYILVLAIVGILAIPSSASADPIDYVMTFTGNLPRPQTINFTVDGTTVTGFNVSLEYQVSGGGSASILIPPPPIATILAWVNNGSGVWAAAIFSTQYGSAMALVIYGPLNFYVSNAPPDAGTPQVSYGMWSIQPVQAPPVGVPEPGTLAMLCVGLAGLSWKLQRRRRP